MDTILIYIFPINYQSQSERTECYFSNLNPNVTHFQQVKIFKCLHESFCRGSDYNKIKQNRIQNRTHAPFYVYCHQLEMIPNPELPDVISWAKRLGCPPVALPDNAVLFALPEEWGGQVASLMHIHPLGPGWTDGLPAGVFVTLYRSSSHLLHYGNSKRDLCKV